MAKPRILAGSAKGRTLETPDRGTRPSPSRLREALFDALQFRERGRFLDLYAGSGAVGLEAASRGFRATLVELDRAAAAVLRRNARRLRLDAEVLQADALTIARARPGRYEVVFAAPPYALDLATIFLEIVRAAPVKAGGVYLFQHPTSLDWASERAHDLAELGHPLERISRRRYGSNQLTRIAAE